MTSKNTTKLLEILKGTKITEPPRFKKIGFKNDNNEVVESIETYLMTARTVECNYSISDTCKDVIAYITKDNQLNVAVANENFISAKLPKKYNEIKICKFNEIYIFLRNEEGMKIYKTVDKKRLEEFATIKYQLEDIVMVDGSTQFYCYIYSDNIHNIYSFKVLGKKLENTLVATYKCPYVANQKRLFVCDEKCYFYEDGQLHNINDKTDFIDGNAIYKLKDGYMVLKEKGNNLLFTPSGTGFTYFIPKIKDAKICVYKELMILYTKEEVYLYTVDANLQLDKVRLKFDCDPESVINTEISIQNKTLMFYLFTMRCKNENLKSKSYDELVTKIDQIKNIPLHKNKMIASDTIPASENNVETIDTPKEAVKDSYEDLQRKIERLIVNVEEQRKKNEEENKAKFLQLLEVVNNHLNETLVRGIENTIKKEVKLGIGQIKKNLDENIKEIEEKTNKLGNKIEMISKGSTAEDNTRASKYLGTFKEVLMSEILPIVENCFEEIKLQMLSNCNFNEMTSVDDVLKKTVSVKDEIANLLESSHANEAVMFAFDCEDPGLLLFLIENLSNANIEKLNPHLQYLMIQKAYCLYKEVQNENILICLCNLIMNIDINELKKDMIMDLLAIFDEVVKIEWSEQIHMNLIVKMQRKHAMKKINKTA